MISIEKIYNDDLNLEYYNLNLVKSNELKYIGSHYLSVETANFNLNLNMCKPLESIYIGNKNNDYKLCGVEIYPKNINTKYDINEIYEQIEPYISFDKSKTIKTIIKDIKS